MAPRYNDPWLTRVEKSEYYPKNDNSDLYSLPSYCTLFKKTALTHSVMTKPQINKHSIQLQGFSPEELLGVVRGARLEHFILSRAECDVRIDHWSMGDFSVDTGQYSFPVRVVGSFSPNKICIGYMRQLTASTWVNGLIADDHTIEFYPRGT